MKTNQQLLAFLFGVYCSTVSAIDDTSTQHPATGENSTTPKTTQSMERYTDTDELARKKEIKELKCTICQTRCKIVYDAGTSTCRKKNGETINGCQQKGDTFAKQCLDRCSEC